MTDADVIRAAELALPAAASASHLTRLRKLGLDYGPIAPLHFTIQGELHLATEGIFLHRTKVMPPTDPEGVTPAAAFIGYAASARIIDLIKVGDWLLHNEHMTIGSLVETACRDRWRHGSMEAIWVTRFLDSRSRSLKESETRAILVFAGLPVPEVNADLYDGERFIACVDLLYRFWRLVIEYEGRQHAKDPAQFNKDIGRYAAVRDGGYEYVQVTQEMLHRPRTLVMRVHSKLVERGYTGPAPVFAGRWRSLFERIPSRPRVRGELASTSS
ncbi:MAG: hypothetical protein M3Q98_11025, partial [Actinomycetota bacterium]|nr:hypothetical protein [Actinomycetota bacterium]